MEMVERKKKLEGGRNQEKRQKRPENEMIYEENQRQTDR